MVVTTPPGLFKAITIKPAAAAIGSPSTVIKSIAGFTRLPCSLTLIPLTATRPCSISSSQDLRLPTPAAARTFCKRIPS